MLVLPPPPPFTKQIRRAPHTEVKSLLYLVYCLSEGFCQWRREYIVHSFSLETWIVGYSGMEKVLKDFLLGNLWDLVPH